MLGHDARVAGRARQAGGELGQRVGDAILRGVNAAEPVVRVLVVRVSGEDRAVRRLGRLTVARPGVQIPE